MAARALFLLMVLPMAAIPSASAQTGGIQVAPVLVTLSGEQSIASLRMRNGRSRPVAFEVDVYAWTQENGQDVLTPTQDVIVAPGIFEIAPDHEQVVRLGVTIPARGDTERAYRLILRELPVQRADGNVLGFTLEMSLPVFVTPIGAAPSLQTRTEARGYVRTIVLSNSGQAHLQLSSVEDMDTGALDAPRYLLAGTSAEVLLPANARTVRLRAAEAAGSQTERIIHVDEQTRHASVR